MPDARVGKYLRTRASISPWQLEPCPSSRFKAVIVIPVLAEGEQLRHSLESLSLNPAALLAETLILVVVNNRNDASEVQKTDNRQLLHWLRSRPYPQLNLAWVDASSAGLELPLKDGVGLARKIGFDLALAHLDWGGAPLLISLDADTLVDSNYLSAIFKHFAASDAGGTYLPFRHRPGENPAQEAAIRSYELYLRSYLFGLQWAGSPYAFMAIGSALACRARSYVAAGGMTRRQAGEDFYFLQQLVKIGRVGPLRGTVVRPSPRFSNRVPFGTGRAVQAEVEAGERLYCFIAADSFGVLKDWLQCVAENLPLSAAELEQLAERISPRLRAFLTEIGFNSAWQKLQANNEGGRLLSAWHGWFDALRTRQLLTRLTESCDSSASGVLVADLLAAGGYPGYTSCVAQLELLERLQVLPAG